jgi:hypothetical protein
MFHRLEDPFCNSALKDDILLEKLVLATKVFLDHPIDSPNVV